jgi:NAD(P)-dependent dehydrogenase (short-subunit alcohol dehydrogenase family)
VVVDAGIGGGSTEVADTPVSEFDAVVDVNLRGAFLTARAAARVLRREGRGSIVVIGSMYGRVPVPGAVAYSASKAAIVSVVKTAALELGPHGVRVNAVAPGYIDTAMRRDALRYRADRLGVPVEQLYAADVAAVPLRRYGTGADVAAAVAFLAGDDAAYVTGQVIDVTGGVSL